MYYTVYKTTNLINGKIYVGVHKTDNLEDEYLGSGKYLLNAIKKYGRENFSKDIIAICDTEEEMYKLEESLVCKAFLTFFSTYNIKFGGDGGFDYVNKNRLNMYGSNDKNLVRGSSLNRGLGPEYRARFCKSVSEGCKTHYKTNPAHFLGRKHSKETCKRISDFKKVDQKGTRNSQFGTCWITNGTSNKKIKIDQEIPVGWSKGRK